MIDVTNAPIDSGVPQTRAKPKQRRVPLKNPVAAAVVDKFADMEPGQSFFVAGAVKKDVDFLRRPLTQAGFGYAMREVDCDEIYQTQGVRIWRQHGEFDEL